MTRPDRYKVTIEGIFITSVGPKTLLEDLEVKAKNLKLDTVDYIRLEDQQGNIFGKRTPKVER